MENKLPKAIGKILETFNSFSPGRIPVTPAMGSWLTVSTHTVGSHTFTDADVSGAGERPRDSDGMYVQLHGEGIVSFELQIPVKSIFFTCWASGSGQTLHVVFRDADGDVVGEQDADIDQGISGQPGDIVFFDSSRNIARMELSLTETSPSFVALDDVGTFVEQDVKSLKALNNNGLRIVRIEELHRGR